MPAGSEDDLLKALVEEWPAYLAYLVAFATIGDGVGSPTP